MAIYNDTNLTETTIKIGYFNGQKIFIVANPLSVKNGITATISMYTTVKLKEMNDLTLEELN